jgi:hypothetical protein
MPMSDGAAMVFIVLVITTVVLLIVSMLDPEFLSQWRRR